MTRSMIFWPRRAGGAAGAVSREDENRQRFNREILPHLDAAYNFARHLSRDGSVAEDIVQLAFERAFRSIDQCRGPAKPWLFAIVRHCFLDWRKEQSRRDHLVAIDGSDVDSVADERWDGTAHDTLGLREAIERLPEPFREALVLRELEEMDYREIAAITQVPIGTVMSRLSRARQMLSSLIFGMDMPMSTERRNTDR